MPPNQQKFIDMTADQRKEIPLLDSYCCRMCKKMKTPQSYSNKELNDYKFKIGNSRPLNAFNSNLRCRACKGEQVHEIQCQGPCGLTKVLDDFSKAQRGRGGKWCKQCIMWKEAAEPGVALLAAPNADLAPDEDADYFDYSGPEGEPDSDDVSISKLMSSRWSDRGWDLDFIPYKSMASLSVQGGVADNNVGNHSENNNTTATAPSVIQPARATMQQAPGNENSKTVSTAESSVSNPYEGRAQGNTPSVASWSIIDPRRRAPPAAQGVAFNAYDPSGQVHTRQRIPSTTEQTPSQYRPSFEVPQRKPSTSSRTPGLGFGAPTPHATAPAPAPVSQTTGRSDWAKPVGHRRELPKFPSATRRVQQRNTSYDTDSEDDNP